MYKTSPVPYQLQTFLDVATLPKVSFVIQELVTSKTDRKKGFNRFYYTWVVQILTWSNKILRKKICVHQNCKMNFWVFLREILYMPQ